MPKTKISEFSATPGNNTDIDGINISEGCAPSGINDAIRELMSQLKDFQAGTAGDSFNGPVGTTTAAAGAFTTLSSTGNTTLGDAAGDTVTVNGTATFANANPTLSAGTANGVAYLNGSKVLTTGSALTFDGSTLTGSNATSAANLVLNNTSGATQTYVNFTSGATVINAINRPNATNDFRFDANYGSIVWGIGSSGTASEQMRLTSTGLGIGTSSPGYRLHVVGGYSTIGVHNTTALPASNGAGGAAFSWNRSNGGAETNICNLYDNAGLSFEFLQKTGTSTANVLFQLRSDLTQFYTNNTERARITSGGDLLVGTTDASVGSGTGIKLRPTGDGVSLPIFIVTTGGSTSASAPIQVYSTGAGAYRFYVNAAGTIFATSTTITAISDQRLKENIQDLDVGLDKIMALKPRKFDWKPGKGKDKKGDRGWIAQEFEQVFPDMIDEWRDPAPEGEEPYKAVNADLIPVLVKAIQELNAKVEAQAAEIAALKGQV